MKIHAHCLISVVCLALSPLAIARPFDASEIHLLESAQSDGKRADNPVIIRFGKRHSLDEDAEDGDLFSVMRRNGKIVDPLIRFGKRGDSIFSNDPMSFPLTGDMNPAGRFRPTRNQKAQIDPLIRFGKRAAKSADMMIRFGRDPSSRPRRPDADTMLRFGRAGSSHQPVLMRLGKKSV
uniref:Uncharacterized protein n=1 Tax=Plectus sambesii TaxID=2011161 RepID=A0A914WSB9_9BILA